MKNSIAVAQSGGDNGMASVENSLTGSVERTLETKPKFLPDKRFC